MPTITLTKIPRVNVKFPEFSRFSRVVVTQCYGSIQCFWCKLEFQAMQHHVICNTRYQPTRHRRHKVWQRSTHVGPPSIYRHGASSPLLAAWLDQRSVRHGGSTVYGPFSIVGGLPAPHRTSRLRHLSTLQWCRRDGRTSGVTLPSTRPGAAGVMAKSPLSKRPKTPMELPGEDRGAVTRPLTGNERERESNARWSHDLLCN